MVYDLKVAENSKASKRYFKRLVEIQMILEK